MKATTLIVTLKKLGIKLYLDGGKLKVSAPKGALTKALQGQIKALKDDIVCFLEQQQAHRHQVHRAHQRIA